MTDPSKAIFLSNASQDAEPVRRIHHALRAAGGEVSFDRLASTQSRTEGCFRPGSAS